MFAFGSDFLNTILPSFTPAALCLHHTFASAVDPSSLPRGSWDILEGRGAAFEGSGQERGMCAAPHVLPQFVFGVREEVWGGCSLHITTVHRVTCFSMFH